MLIRWNLFCQVWVTWPVTKLLMQMLMFEHLSTYYVKCDNDALIHFMHL